MEKTNQNNVKISLVLDLGQFASFWGGCFFAFSGKFNIIFSENEFSQIVLCSLFCEVLYLRQSLVIELWVINIVTN